MKLSSDWLCHTMNNATHPRTTRPARSASRMPARKSSAATYGSAVDTTKHENVLLRREIGEVLRSVRQHQGRTLRGVVKRTVLRGRTVDRDSKAGRMIRRP